VASVVVDIAGIELTLHMAIRRGIDGGYAVELPTFRCRGQRVATVILPAELSQAIGREVYEVWQDWGRTGY
jgi:hypothetical protein